MTRTRISSYVGPGQEINDPSLLSRYENKNWIAEKKYDGIWCLVETNDDGYVENLSTRTGVKIIDKKIINKYFGIPNSKFIVEYESLTEPSQQAIASRGFACMYMFDVLQIVGKETKDFEFQKRTELVKTACDIIKANNNQFMICAEQKDIEFENFFWKCLEDPIAEGIVLKRLDKSYRAQTSSGKTDDWIRVKLKRTVDLYVMSTGLTDNRSPNLTMGMVRDGNMVEVQSMSVPKGFKAKDLVGKVLECNYDRKHNSERYRHLRFKRVRSDKTKEMTG